MFRLTPVEFVQSTSTAVTVSVTRPGAAVKQSAFHVVSN